MTGELLALAALAMFSTNIIITKVASARLNVGTGFLISVIVNTLFCLLLFGMEGAFFRDAPLVFDGRGIVMFVLAGICSTYLGRWFFFEAIARLGPARASLFQVSSPLFTVVIAWVFLGEALGPLTLAAMLCTIVGLFVVSAPASVWKRSRAGKVANAPLRRDWRVWARSGVAIGTGSAVAYALGSVLRGAAVRQWNEAILGALLGAIAALILHLVVGAGRRQLGELRGADRTALALYSLGGVLTILAQIATIASMRHIPVAISAVITLCTPLLVIPASIVLLKNQERIGAITLVGAALALSGMVVIVLA